MKYKSCETAVKYFRHKFNGLWKKKKKTIQKDTASLKTHLQALFLEHLYGPNLFPFETFLRNCNLFEKGVQGFYKNATFQKTTFSSKIVIWFWTGHWKPFKGCSLILTAALQGNRLCWQLFSNELDIGNVNETLL